MSYLEKRRLRREKALLNAAAWLAHKANGSQDKDFLKINESMLNFLYKEVLKLSKWSQSPKALCSDLVSKYQ